MALKIKDLRLELQVQPRIEARVEPGQDILAIMTECLETLSKDIKTIQEMEVPLDALEDAKQSNTEVRKVSITGIYERHCYLGYHYIVAYHTIRGRELGRCRTYNSRDLEEYRGEWI